VSEQLRLRITFEQKYLDYLIKLGEADAEARCGEICKLLDF
jgi:hypothetical protein